MESEDTRRRSPVLHGGTTQEANSWNPSGTTGAPPHRPHSSGSADHLGAEDAAPRNDSARIPSSSANDILPWEPDKDLSSAKMVHSSLALSGRDGQLSALANLVGLKDLERPLRQLRKHDMAPNSPDKKWTLTELHPRDTGNRSYPRRLQQTEEALRQAEEDVSKVRTDSEQILREAREQADAVREAAYSEGKQKAEKETQDAVGTTRAILAEMQAWHDRLLADSEGVVLGLVRDVARALFGEGFALAEDVLRAAFERAMTEARAIGNLRIHVNPEDAMALGSDWWQHQQSALGGQRIELVASEHVRRGGCYIEGEFGLVDARIETQLKTALQTLNGGGA